MKNCEERVDNANPYIRENTNYYKSMMSRTRACLIQREILPAPLES